MAASTSAWGRQASADRLGTIREAYESVFRRLNGQHIAQAVLKPVLLYDNLAAKPAFVPHFRQIRCGFQVAFQRA